MKSSSNFPFSLLNSPEFSFPSPQHSSNAQKSDIVTRLSRPLSLPAFLSAATWTKIHRINSTSTAILHEFYLFPSAREKSRIDQGRSNARREIKLIRGEGWKKRSVNRIRFLAAVEIRVFAELCKSTGCNHVLSSEGGMSRRVASVVTFVTRPRTRVLFVSRHVCSASIFYIPLGSELYLFARKNLATDLPK